MIKKILLKILGVIFLAAMVLMGGWAGLVWAAREGNETGLLVALLIVLIVGGIIGGIIAAIWTAWCIKTGIRATSETLQYSSRADIATGNAIRSVVEVLKSTQQPSLPALPPGQGWTPFPPLQGFKNEVIDTDEYREE